MEKRKLPSFVTVLILTLITVIFWVSFDVYRLFVKPAQPSVPASVSAPLTPTLDQDAINELESQVFISDSEIPDNVVTLSAPNQIIIPSPSPEAGSTPSASPAASPIPSPQSASSSGTPI